MQEVTQRKKEIVVLDHGEEKPRKRGEEIRFEVLPRNDSVVVLPRIGKGAEMKVRLANFYGRSVYSRNFEGVTEAPISIDLNDHKKGVYILKLSVNGKLEKEKMVIKLG